MAGDTDSERCFYLFLSRLRARAGLDGAGIEDVRAALADTTEVVLGIADRVASPKPSSLTFLVSDGRVLGACRRGRTLHVASAAGGRALFAVASERIGEADWVEVPEGGFAGTEDGIRAIHAPLRA